MTLNRMVIRFPALVAAVFLAARVTAADFVVINANATGPGSLAQAITDANSLPGPDRIVFNIPGAGVQTINVAYNYLPKITDPLTIDGYTQPGSKPNTLAVGTNAVILIRIDGAYADATSYQEPQPVGIWIAAPDCTVRGLMITRFSFFTQGIHCCAYGGGYGIIATDRSVIEGNFIGTDGSASMDLGNRPVGILVSGSGYRIGGTGSAARNLIGGTSYFSGPNGEGIRAGDSSGASIVGNQIGRFTSVGASDALEGARNDVGIALYGAWTNSVIGGTAPGTRNVISGNGIGIRTAHLHTEFNPFYTDATGAIIQGNLIGAEPNSATGGNSTGIELRGTNHVVGGIDSGAGNSITANGDGVVIDGTQNIVSGNDIEMNSGAGVSVSGNDNVIGGLGLSAGNVIAQNQKGVVVTGLRDRIISNLIYANTAPAQIDLGSDGPTSNDLGDADTGANKLQNFPIIISVVESGATPSSRAS